MLITCLNINVTNKCHGKYFEKSDLCYVAFIILESFDKLSLNYMPKLHYLANNIITK